MRTLRLLIRWSWRDLRAHWAKVLAIALVIAIGTGGYAGLTSTAEWRRVSYDASYEQLAMYDLRVDLATGSYIEYGELTGAVLGIPSADAVTGVTERLIVPTQVDASTPEETVLVRGEITGSDFSGGGPAVVTPFAHEGRLLTHTDSGQPMVMIERQFAKFYDIPPTRSIKVSGGRQVESVALATTPETFYVAPEGEIFMTEASFAILFTTLETAQELAGQPGMVNNLVLTIAEGADRDRIQAEMEQALAPLPAGTTVLTRDDNLSYDALTSDIDGDQAMFNALAFLLFAGAVGAAFNLIHRLAEQQRREIGIGMALGIKPHILAFRPLLVSAQIALLGVLMGIGVGALIGNAMGGLLADFVPLPEWQTDFQTVVFARVAVIGLVVPFLASAIPVWRSVRVTPVEAIRPRLTASGLNKGGRPRIRNTFAVIPFRNLRRTPRRTALTVFGIAAAITVLVGFLGIMDSVFDAVDTAETEAVGESPERVTVGFDGFRLEADPAVQAVGSAASVGAAEPTLRVTGSVQTPAAELDMFIELADFTDGMWAPSVTAGSLEPGGLIVSRKAAADLGVGVGDLVTFRHPVREGLVSYTFVESEIPITGLHPHPVRALVYMDLADAALFNLSGIVNGVNALPADGFTSVDVKRELFELDQVSSVQSVTAVTQAVRDAFEEFLGIIQMMVGVVLLLALLIAFNTAAINLDARAREHATMFAFGVKVRTALRMATVETFVIGVMATVIGTLGGLAMVWWMTQRLFADTLPDFEMEVILRPSTVIVVGIMGVVAVTLAPLLTTRRMRKMDLPGTLRLVE